MMSKMISYARLALLAVAFSGGVSCISHRFAEPAPSFYGIVIPLPPPSFADAGKLAFAIEGRIRPGSAAYDGGTANLWDGGAEQGYYVPTVDGAFRFNEVLIDLRNNCLELTADDSLDERVTEASYRKLVVRDGATCDTGLCTARDTLGACACLEVPEESCF